MRRARTCLPRPISFSSRPGRTSWCGPKRWPRPSSNGRCRAGSTREARGLLAFSAGALAPAAAAGSRAILGVRQNMLAWRGIDRRHEASPAMAAGQRPAADKKRRRTPGAEGESAWIHEEATFSTVAPFMPVMNNLVLYKQDVPQNSMQSIVPDLATSWSWNPDHTELTFKLRDGVKWHDCKPFTANDVKCTFDMLRGLSSAKLRKNPRKTWYDNVTEVTTSGDYQASFHLKRAQPALLALLASGYSPVYPCHVSPADMRTRPIGTGPFKFVEFKPNESIKLTRNSDYWNKDRPYLDAIEFTIITNRSTAILAFIAGKFDMTFPTEVTIPLLKDVQSQVPQAVCELVPTNVSTNLIVNREAPPFDNAELRRAMALAIDRKAFVDILSEGKNDIGGSMLPPPAGVWGMPPEILKTIPGYGPDVHQNRAEARSIVANLW